MSALDTQVGGDHYKTLKIQPMQYSMANKLDACQHTIIKYVTRFRAKGGIADLEKARHCIDMLIEFEKAGIPPLEWPADEQRIDIIGQNGNDGEHYGWVQHDGKGFPSEYVGRSVMLRRHNGVESGPHVASSGWCNPGNDFWWSTIIGPHSVNAYCVIE